jgi:hypothetical protein
MKKKFEYRDPLHVPFARLVVVHNGKEVMILNKALLDQQRCWENLEEIKATHQEKYKLYDLINSTDDRSLLQSYEQKLRQLEYTLQSLWKFDLNGNFHRIWEYPKCECPKLDNRDRYPHGHIISEGCPLHGLLED